MSNAAEKVRSYIRALEEGGVDLAMIEARKGPTIQAQRPSRHDQVGALERAVPECRFPCVLGIAAEQLDELIGCVRHQTIELEIEMRVIADYDRSRRAEHFGFIARIHAFDEALLRSLAADPDEPGGIAIGGGRPERRGFIEFANFIVAKFVTLPAVVGPCLVEKAGNGRLWQAPGPGSIDGDVAHTLDMAAIPSTADMKTRYVHSSSRRQEWRPGRNSGGHEIYSCP